MGPQKCLYYSAIRDEIQIPLLSDMYKSFKSDAEIQKSSETLKESEQTLVNDDNADEESGHKDNFILTMSQAIMDNITTTSDKSANADETIFESFTQVISYFINSELLIIISEMNLHCHFNHWSI